MVGGKSAVLAVGLGIGLVALGGAGAGVGRASKPVQLVHIHWHRAPHAAATRRAADVPEPALDPRYDTTPTPSGGESIPQEFTNWTGETGPGGIPDWARADWLTVAIAAGMVPDPSVFVDTIQLAQNPLSFGVRFLGSPGYWIHFTAPGLGTTRSDTGVVAGLRYAKAPNGACILEGGDSLLGSGCPHGTTPGGYYLEADCSSVGYGWTIGYWPAGAPGTPYNPNPPCFQSFQQTLAGYDGQGQLYDTGPCCAPSSFIVDGSSPHFFEWGQTFAEFTASFALDQPLQLYTNQPYSYSYAFTPHYNGAGFRAAIAGTSVGFRRLWDNALDPAGYPPPTGPDDGGPPPSNPTLSLSATGPSSPFTSQSEGFALHLGGVAAVSSAAVNVTVSGANSASSTRTLVGTDLSFSYTGTQPGTDTVTASATIDGQSVTSNAVKLTWLAGPDSGPGRLGPSSGPTDPTNYSNQPTRTLSDPINTLTGNFYVPVTDATLPGPGVPFAVTRSYNSLDSTVGPFGEGWTSDLLPSLTIDDAGNVTARSGTGQQVALRLEPDGSYTAADGTLVTLVKAGDGTYTLTLHDASVETYTARGRLLTWLDANGQGLTCSYDGAGNLGSVTDTAGATVHFSYAGGQLTSAALPDGTSVTYGYDGDLLTSVTDPAGKVTHYGYDAAGHMTTITDPDGHTLITNRYDDEGRIVQQDDALGNTATFDWGSGTQTLAATDSTGATWTDTYENGELVQRVDPLGGATAFSYDASFDLTSVTDPRGLATHMTYDGRSNLLSRTYADGSSESWTYDNGNRVTSHTDADGNTTVYAYDGNGNLLRTTDPAGDATVYTVDATTGLPLSMTDPLGRTTTYRYDGAGNLVETDSPAGARTTMSYDALGRLVAQTDPRGNTSTSVYTADGRLASRTDALGRTTSYSYDNAGHLVAQTDPNGHTTRYEYDASGRKTADVAADGGRTTYSHDGVDNLVATTDPNGNTTRYQYDALARQTAMTMPDGATWQYGYDADGNQTTTTDPLGHTTTTSYDARNRPLGTISPLGSRTRTDYDANGNVVATYDPRGLVPGADPSQYATRQSYDSLGHMIRSTDPLGDSTSYAYDAAGQLVATTDPRGDTTRYGYDADGNQTSVTAADGSVTRYAYDSAGNVTSRTDPNGHVTRWTYDADSEKASLTNPIGAHWSYAYDPAGNLVRTVTASGGTISQSFDAMNRVTHISYSDRTPSVNYAYDLDGNRLSMHDGSGTETYSYDPNNQLTGASRGSNSFSYAYNSAGELTQRVYPGGFTTQLGYDADGNLVSASSPAGPTQYGYDAAGNVVSTTLANGIAEARTYDAAGRLIGIDATRGGSPFSSRDYRLDANGNPTTVTAVAPPPGDSPPSFDHGTHAGWTETYSYDNRDRLVQACLDTPCQKHDDPSYAYSYDPVGNMLSQQTPRGTTRYSYNAADELTNSRGPGPDLSYSYDPNGNQTRAGSTRYRYDIANQLTSATGPGVFALYTYDGNGNLLTRRSPGNDVQYQWDTNAALPQLAAEQGPHDTLLRTYGYGVGDTPVTLTSSGRSYSYLTDRLGSVIGLTSANGAAVAGYRYDPYGALLDSNGDGAPSDRANALNPILFTGQYLDQTTDLYGLRARNYDTSLARFLQIDPLAARNNAPYASTYSYVQDQPTNLTDPSGEKPVSTPTSNTSTRRLQSVPIVVLPKLTVDITIGNCKFSSDRTKMSCSNTWKWGLGIVGGGALPPLGTYEEEVSMTVKDRRADFDVKATLKQGLPLLFVQASTSCLPARCGRWSPSFIGFLNFGTWKTTAQPLAAGSMAFFTAFMGWAIVGEVPLTLLSGGITPPYPVHCPSGSGSCKVG